MFLLLKIVLVPALVASVTIAGRRWGPRIGGWLTALPVVAGPTLCFYAIEQGNGFAARAAQTTLAGLVAVAAHSVAYAWSCRRVTWPVSITLGWLAFAGVTFVLYQVQPNLIISLVLALASFAIAEKGSLWRVSRSRKGPFPRANPYLVQPEMHREICSCACSQRPFSSLG